MRLQTGFIIGLLLWTIASPAIASSPTLCKGGEQVVFACAIRRSAKSLALCLRGDRLIYRFGKPGSVELEYPAKNVAATEAFKRTQDVQTAGRSSLSSYQALAFTIASTTYTLVHKEDRRPVPPVRFARLSIGKRHKHLATLACEDDFVSTWALLDGRLFNGAGPPP